MQEKQTLEVLDLAEAAALSAALSVFPEIVPRGGRCGFVFIDEAGKASAVLQKHRAGLLKLSTLAVAQAAHSVRNGLFNTRRAEGLD